MYGGYTKAWTYDNMHLYSYVWVHINLKYKISDQSTDNCGFYGLKTLNRMGPLYGDYTKAWTYGNLRSHSYFGVHINL